MDDYKRLHLLYKQVSQPNLHFELGLSPDTSFVTDSLFVEFSHRVCVHGLIWTLVASLLCDMGIPPEDSHRARAAHAIYLR
jgi:hypothetical protein